jgi:hypothetical protein
MLTQSSCSSGESAHDFVLKEAKRLHRLAVRGALVFSLPILRRLLRARMFPDLSLPELNKRRDTIRRKHILRMLAIESGFRSWEQFKPAITSVHLLDLPLKKARNIEHSRLHMWFASHDSACRYASAHEGEVVCIGDQAVVLPRSTTVEEGA